MPKKAKENEELKETEKKQNTKSKTSTKKVASRKTDTSTSKNSTKKSTKTTTTKKSTSKVTKKSSTKSAKKEVSSKKKSTKKITTNPIPEYYDLPQKYNQTVVKILAQTPKTLFIYWEISDSDISGYKEKYGENFFEITKPVLIVYNDTLHYSFEVEINDFANSWYLHINDSKSDYRIELGRRPIIKNENIQSDYIYVSSSNEIETPNDHILFDNSQKMVYFRNVKTNKVFSKELCSISFIRNMGKIYHIYDLYKEFYKNEDNIEFFSNPSSHI